MNLHGVIYILFNVKQHYHWMLINRPQVHMKKLSRVACQFKLLLYVQRNIKVIISYEEKGQIMHWLNIKQTFLEVNLHWPWKLPSHGHFFVSLNFLCFASLYHLLLYKTTEFAHAYSTAAGFINGQTSAIGI